jgi:hypothetical protein
MMPGSVLQGWDGEHHQLATPKYPLVVVEPQVVRDAEE